VTPQNRDHKQLPSGTKGGDSVISLSKVGGKQPSQDVNSDLGIGSASYEAIFRKVAREKMSRSLRRQVGISSLVYCLVLIFKIA